MAYNRYKNSGTSQRRLLTSYDDDDVVVSEKGDIKPVVKAFGDYVDECLKEKRTQTLSESRVYELHPSSFPYCALWHTYDIFKNGGPVLTQEVDYYGNYYTGLGTFKHELIQDWLGKGEKIIGDWVCKKHSDKDKPCKGKRSCCTYKACPKCGGEMEYRELGIKFGKYTHGHIDGVFFWKGKYYVLDYKGLALDTPIPTPSGWTTMGKIKVGDELFGSDGKPCKVVSKSSIHKRKCYKITFDDTSSVVCDDEHLWVTYPGIRKTTPKVLSTEEIKDTLYHSGGQRQHRVMVAKPLMLPEKQLPIDPYVLGCWIGDGAAANGRISKPDNDLFRQIKKRGYVVSKNVEKREGMCQTRNIIGLAKQLNTAGLKNNKHIPAEYLRGSIEQRTALLHGLMDTDGSWNKVRKQAVFCTTDKRMAEDFVDLACGLGQRALLNTVQATGFGKTITAYQVTFVPINGFTPFRMKRKRNLVESGIMSGIRSSQRIIMSVDEVPAVKTQCLEVDSADRTYLCTRSMIPTHNTTGQFKLFQHKAGRKIEFPFGYNKAQIESYCYFLKKTHGLEIEGWILVYISRDKSFRDYVSVGEILSKSERKRISETVKRYDRHFGIAIKAKKYDDIIPLIEEKPCKCRSDYQDNFHNDFDPCPLAKNGICFKRDKLESTMKKLAVNMSGAKNKTQAKTKPTKKRGRVK